MLTDRDYELLSNYLDDALNAAERADLETRLKAELELRRELDALRGTVALVKALPARKAPRNFTLDASMVRPVAARRWWSSPVLVSTLSAAAAVLLIGFGLLSLTSRQNAASPVMSLAVEQQGAAALLPTETPLMKASDGSLATTAVSEVPGVPPQASVTTVQTGGNDVLNQPSGGGGEVGATRDQQEGQQPAPLPEEAQTQVNAAALPQATAAAPSLFFAPTIANGTPQGFSAPGAASGTVENYNAQASEAGLAAQADQASIAPAATQLAPVQRTMDTATLTETVPPTMTATPQPSATPTVTPVPPTMTPQATLTPTAAPPSSDALPLVSLGLGVALLLVSVIFYLRNRKSA